MGYKIDDNDPNLRHLRASAEAAGGIEERLRAVATAHGRGGTALAASALATQAMILRQALTAFAAGETAIGAGLNDNPDTMPSWYVRDEMGHPIVED